MIVAWQCCRSSSIKKVELGNDHYQCWNAFYTTLASTVPATCLIYGLMIHSVQIDPLRICSKAGNKFGVKHTVVMADQALHDISYGLREQASPDDDIGILLSCV